MNRENIEEILKKLGAEDVPADVRKIAEETSANFSRTLTPSRRHILWSDIMKSPIVKLAAAAVIIIAVLAGINYFGGSIDVATRAYGITDLPELLQSARTLHITGWGYYPEKERPGKVQGKVALEHWFDMENGLVRFMSMGWSWNSGNSNETVLYLSEKIIDGQYEMIVDHTRKSVGFYKLSDFQRRLAAKQNIGFVIKRMLGNVDQLDDFVKTGREVVDGTIYDIWQGEVSTPVINVTMRIKSWLSPTSGELGRVFVWEKQQDGWSAVYEIDKIERNIELPVDIFVTEPPEGYTLVRPKEDARMKELNMEGGVGINGLWIDNHISFTLEDGSVVVGWHSIDQQSDESQDELFEGLQMGGPVPKLPIEINALMPIGISESIRYEGRHLCWTRKDDRFHEWSIYVPEKVPPARSDILGYHVLHKFNPSDRIKGGSIGLDLMADLLIETQEDFDRWVLGAMAELSDDGIAPEHVTYESVLELAEKVHDSLHE